MSRKGYFGQFGGMFVPETVMPALEELEKAYRHALREKRFNESLAYYLREYAGRPTPLYYAENLTRALKGPKVYLKREDLLHTGAHKINNTIAQALLAKKMNKKHLVAETGAGQHGVATAAAAALFKLQCRVYMGYEDWKRQSLNVFRMKLMGAEVIPVYEGSMTLKEAINEAMRDWVPNVRDTHYCLGSVVGPHPYPSMVRDFQCVIGREARAQIIKKEKRLPDYLVACVGAGSNSIGLFYPFLKDKNVTLLGVEAAGKGLSSGKHAASLLQGSVGVLHGAKEYILQNSDGQISTTHSISAGLDYPGVGPEHSFLKDTKRASYIAVTDGEALKAFTLLSEQEGMIPALESAHAIAALSKKARIFRKKDIVIVSLSGRGDKDIDIAREALTL